MTVLIFIVIVFALSSISTMSAESENNEYNRYAQSFERIFFEQHIENSGFRVIEEQAFEIDHAGLGRLRLIPAISRGYNRLSLFFVREDGYVVYKTDDFESNSWLRGQARQTNQDVICIAYRDLNGDDLKDIIIISACRNESGVYAGKTYNVGDVLFQSEIGFYRDLHISDKINRFDMNKNSEAIMAFVRDGESMEFLFTSKTLDELLKGGFQPISYMVRTEHLEKFGVVSIIPGFYNMTGQNYLMIYIIASDGRILWNFQPMHYYVNFYDIQGIMFIDIDGDGLKDMTLLARYVTYDENGDIMIKQDYDIYYQRAGYFLEDWELKNAMPCGENESLMTISRNARKFRGWHF